MNPRTANCRLPSGPLLVLIRLAPEDPLQLAALHTCCIRIADSPAGQLVILIDSHAGSDTELAADAAHLAAALEAGALAIPPGVTLTRLLP